VTAFDADVEFSLGISPVRYCRAIALGTQKLRNSKLKARYSFVEGAAYKCYMAGVEDESSQDTILIGGEASIPLHLLGWKSFQDLGIAVAEECLRRPVQTFLPTNDAGRDGAFVGKWEGDSLDAGESTIQCKFTSDPTSNLSLSMLDDELDKAKALAARGLANDYIILTNHSLTGQSELAIKSAFESAGVGRCRIFGYTWLERQLKRSPRLRMMAPRVYGLGDLSQLVDGRTYRQAKLILSAMGDEISKLVVTDAHRRAVRAVSEHSLVLLLGAPAAGKSTIGASIAVGAADIWKAKTIRVTSPVEIQKKLEPGSNQFFWVDDAWGNMQYQRHNTEAWNQLFPLMQAAMRKNTRFLITSRDYIWNSAKQDLKLQAIPILAKSQVVINVQDFTTQEKAQILYNHVKFGDQSKQFRITTKLMLPEIAEKKNFLPEVARRFGSTFFAGQLSTSKESIGAFFENPQAFLLETISGLTAECRAAVALIFLNAGKVRSPVAPEDADAAAKAFGVDTGRVRAELQNLNGSLLLLVTDDVGSYWTYKHPTIGDAFARYVANSPELIEIYLRGAKPESVAREVVCAGVSIYGASVVAPDSLHGLLASRLEALPGYEIVAFLSYRANKAFTAMMIERRPNIMERLRSFATPIKDDTDASLLAKLHEYELLPEEYRVNFVSRVREAAIEEADSSFLDDDAIGAVLTSNERLDILSEVQNEVIARIDEHIDRLRSEWSKDYPPDDQFTNFEDSIKTFATALGDETFAKTVMAKVEMRIAVAVEYMNDGYEPSSTVSAPTGPSSTKSTVLANLFRDIDE
jgi:hypothetical protein